MVFSVIYQTQTCINLGSIYISSHTISDAEDDETFTYSTTLASGLTFDPVTGNFTIKGDKIGHVKFVITVKNNKGVGYNIPINIEVIDKLENYLQYSYQTGYSFSASFHLYPTYTPETDDDYEYESDYVYMLVGAPAGIMIDSSTGQIYGSPINYGQFISTVNVISQKTNNFVCSASLQFMIYNSNILTDIIDIFPNNEIIHTKNLPLTITCNYVGAPPSQAQSLAYKLSSPSIESNSIMNFHYR
jgi:hypothetical protein